MKMKMWKQCGRKIRYRDEHTANYYRRKGEEQRGVKLDYYWCRYCNGFHLTSRMEWAYETEKQAVACAG